MWCWRSRNLNAVPRLVETASIVPRLKCYLLGYAVPPLVDREHTVIPMFAGVGAAQEE